MALLVLVEAAPKRTFVSACDWPGWARAGRAEEAAIEAFLAAAPRYAAVATLAGLEAPFVESPVLEPDAVALDVVERLPGGSGTEFGVPSAIAEADRRPTDDAAAARLAALVASAWMTFDAVVARAPAELRKGPRGGGRDRDRIVAHVDEADHAYAREIGVRVRPPRDRAEVVAMRAAMLEALRRPSDGGPLADRRWTARYAAHRIAWHALDHAWEIEDRTESA